MYFCDDAAIRLVKYGIEKAARKRWAGICKTRHFSCNDFLVNRYAMHVSDGQSNSILYGRCYPKQLPL